MFGYNCKQCKKVIFLIDKENEQIYFRLGNNEEFYCIKCEKDIKLNENDKIIRSGKTFVTIIRSDY